MMTKRRKRRKPEQIVKLLQEGEAMFAAGKSSSSSPALYSLAKSSSYCPGCGNDNPLKQTMPKLCEKCGSQIPAINTGPTPTDPTLFYSCQNCGHSVRGIIDCLGPPPEKSVKMYARFNGVVTKEEIFQLHKLFPYLQTASVVDLYKLASTERSLYLGEAGESMFEELKAKTLKQNLSIDGVSVDGTC